MLVVFDTPARVESSHCGEGYSHLFINSNKRDLEDLIADSSLDNSTKKTMSSVPHGVRSVRGFHSNMDKHLTWDIAVNKIYGYERESANQKFQINQQNLDHPLAKYNSKLMKSIWGMYNRYSVHNLKSFTEGDNNLPLGAQQLHAVVAPTSPSSSKNSIKGGFKNGPLSSPQWDPLKIGHTY